MARSLPVEIIAREFMAGDRRPGARGEQAQQITLALGELDRFIGAPQLAALDAEGVVAHPDLVARFVTDPAAAHDVLEAEDEFAGLKRLGDIVVDAGFEAFNAVLRLRPGRQHADGDRRDALELAGEVQPALARHHDVEDHEVESETAHGGPGGYRVAGSGNAEAVVLQVSAEQIPDPMVVVDQQNVGGVVR